MTEIIRWTEKDSRAPCDFMRNAFYEIPPEKLMLHKFLYKMLIFYWTLDSHKMDLYTDLIKQEQCKTNLC